MSLIGLSGATLAGCALDESEITLAEQEHAIITLTDTAAIVYKPRSGLSAMIQEANAASAGRLPSLWRLNELEGSGMTEPGAAGMHVWEGTIVEDDDGNRTYTGSWRVATQAESDEILAGTDPF